MRACVVVVWLLFGHARVVYESVRCEVWNVKCGLWNVKCCIMLCRTTRTVRASNPNGPDHEKVQV